MNALKSLGLAIAYLAGMTGAGLALFALIVAFIWGFSKQPELFSIVSIVLVAWASVHHQRTKPGAH